MDVATVKKFTKFTANEIRPKLENLLNDCDISRRTAGESNHIKYLDKFVNERTIGKEHIYYYIISSMDSITEGIEDLEKNAKIYVKNIKKIKKEYTEFMDTLKK